MRQWMFRLSLSLMVIVGFWTNRLPAQQVFVVPATPYVPAYHPPAPPAFHVPQQPSPAGHSINRTLNKYGMNCGVDPFYPNCGNLHYELGFIFGSCRYWMAESCPPTGQGAHGGQGGQGPLGCWNGNCNRNGYRP